MRLSANWIRGECEQGWQDRPGSGWQRDRATSFSHPKGSDILNMDFDSLIFNFFQVISIKKVGIHVRFHLLFNAAHSKPKVDGSFLKNSAFTRSITKVFRLLDLWFLKRQFSALEPQKKYSIYRKKSIFIIYYLGQFVFVFFSFLLFVLFQPVEAFILKTWGQLASWYKSEYFNWKVIFFHSLWDWTIIMLKLLHLHIRYFRASCHNHSST